MKRTKRNNRKTIMFVSLFLSCMAMVGVIFASWVIINPEVTQNESGTITVDTVVDESLGLTLEWVDSKNVIHYGSNSAVKDGKWLISNEGAVEVLTVTLKVTIANAKNLNTITTTAITSTGGETVDGKTGYAGAFSDNLVGALPTPSVGTVSSVDSDGKATCLITVTFTWGTAFGDPAQNPYDYYNDQEYSNELATDANTKLTNLATYLTGVQFSFTVSATAKASA